MFSPATNLCPNVKKQLQLKEKSLAFGKNAVLIKVASIKRSQKHINVVFLFKLSFLQSSKGNHADVLMLMWTEIGWDNKGCWGMQTCIQYQTLGQVSSVLCIEA